MMDEDEDVTEEVVRVPYVPQIILSTSTYIHTPLQSSRGVRLS